MLRLPAGPGLAGLWLYLAGGMNLLDTPSCRFSTKASWKQGNTVTDRPGGAAAAEPRRRAPPYLCEGALLFVQVPRPGRGGAHQRGCGRDGVSQARA